MIIDSRFVCISASVILAIAIQQAFALKCWECRSDHDPKCADPFDNTTFILRDCLHRTLDHLPGAKSHLCRKIRQKVHGVWKYFRSCAFLGEPGIEDDERFCLMRTGTYNIFMEYCTCNSKDGCNSSSIPSKSKLIFLLSVILPFLAFNVMR